MKVGDFFTAAILLLLAGCLLYAALGGLLLFVGPGLVASLVKTALVARSRARFQRSVINELAQK